MARCAICNKDIDSGLVVDAECLKRAKVLPCMVGDTLYYIAPKPEHFSNKQYQPRIEKYEVIRLSIGQKGFTSIQALQLFGFGLTKMFTSSQIGKEIYFSPEEALKALQEVLPDGSNI